jgi:hypothetical protein
MEIGCTNIILTGDWNAVLDLSIDYDNYKKYKQYESARNGFEDNE